MGIGSEGPWAGNSGKWGGVVFPGIRSCCKCNDFFLYQKFFSNFSVCKDFFITLNGASPLAAWASPGVIPAGSQQIFFSPESFSKKFFASKNF